MLLCYAFAIFLMLTISNVIASVPGDCSLEPDPGLCPNSTVYIQKYHFNAAKGDCVLFLYSGCQGNGNRFDTKASCISTCLIADQSLTTCTTPSSPLLPPEKYWMRSSFFQIFRQLKITCNGYALKWKVISRVAKLDGLYLAVWRPLPTNKPMFQLVGVTTVSNLSITPNVWSEITIKDNFAVSPGDVLGFFYKSWLFTDFTSSIPLMPGTNKLDSSTGMLTDEAFVSQLQASDIFSSANISKDTVSLTPSARVSRRPALALVVGSASASSSATPSVPTEEPSSVYFTATLRTTTSKKSSQSTVTPNANGGSKSNTPPTSTSQTMTATTATVGLATTTFSAVTNTPPRLTVSVTAAVISSSGTKSEDCLDAFRMAGACNYDINAFKTRWYFDKFDARCEMFWYYPACVDSTNIFLSKDLCEQICAQYLNKNAPSSLLA